MNQTEFIRTRLNSYSSTSQEPLVIDGKSYKTVKIGNDIWMAENLAYDDKGEGIFKLSGITYYTWDAAMRIAKNIDGWHLPDKSEFEKLIKESGGEMTAGKSLKSKSGWKSGCEGNNSSGFSARPAGYKISQGRRAETSWISLYWSSTSINDWFSWHLSINSSDFVSIYGDAKVDAYPIRLIKD